MNMKKDVEITVKEDALSQNSKSLNNCKDTKRVNEITAEVVEEVVETMES